MFGDLDDATRNRLQHLSPHQRLIHLDLFGFVIKDFRLPISFSVAEKCSLGKRAWIEDFGTPEKEKTKMDYDVRQELPT